MKAHWYIIIIYTRTELVYSCIYLSMWIFFVSTSIREHIICECVHGMDTHDFKVPRPIPVASRRLRVGCHFGYGIVCVYQLRCKVRYYFGMFFCVKAQLIVTETEIEAFALLLLYYVADNNFLSFTMFK